MGFKRGNKLWKLRNKIGAPKGTKPWNTGKKLSHIIRKKISQAHLGKKPWNKGLSTGPLTKEHKEKLSSIHKGKKKSSQWKRKIGLANKGHKHTEVTKDRLRIARLNQKNIPNKNTSIELKIKGVLDVNNINYVQQHKLGNLFSCDFYLPDHNLVIECDGDYWHSLPLNKKYDRKKRIYCYTQGIGILRLSERSINKRIAWCERKILINIHSLGIQRPNAIGDLS